MNIFHLLIIGSMLFMASFTALAIEIRVANFSQGDLSGWKEKSFLGHTQYKLVESGNSEVLRASTHGKASGLFREITVDLTQTPYLHWSWKVENIFHGNNERSKTGDDYPARIYVVVSGGLFFWKTRAVNYVWASHEAIGSEWPNAFTSNAMMVAVQSGKAKLGQWVHERRNVREDLKHLFGEDFKRINAVAVMVDGDNTGQSAESYFGDIYFSSE
jgi:hypothetical protein